MTDLANLLELVGYVALMVVPAILFTRWLTGADGPGIADILAGPREPSWPRGVQEEEPVRWHVEALHPRRAAGSTANVAEPRRAGRPIVAVGRETSQCA
ncbi:MAG TPA: hypothetical protein VFW02_06895 [Candidatus Limnocylindrales bacterium]|nr:hypothetical protein [Candidatus Limnocylindrales bacterium]